MIDDIRSEWRKDAIRSYVRLFWLERSIESSLSQANEVKEQRRDRERRRSKGLRDEGVKDHGGRFKARGGRLGIKVGLDAKWGGFKVWI